MPPGTPIEMHCFNHCLCKGSHRIPISPKCHASPNSPFSPNSHFATHSISANPIAPNLDHLTDSHFAAGLSIDYDVTEAVRRLQNTLSEIGDWMSSNRLKLNPSKTQWIWIGTRMQLAKIDKRELLERFPEIVFESSVVDLGVVIDQELKMDAHVGIMTRSCFYQLRQLRTIRQSLSDDATRMLIHSFVVTRVDYCNSVLSGISVVQTDRVQRILNAAARLLLRIQSSHRWRH